MGLDHIRSEIEHMRRQILRQRKEIQSLSKAGISTASAEALLARMQEKVDGICAERERLNGEERLKRPTYASGKVIHGPTGRR
ncbi:hypothetical protein [Rhodopseudomonas sp. RCAM05734]|uniref:hypothetical protein n=1 Tax=Rhodopseudomonas sp. RCAM05734 TaxID=3457549 RepID=UPI0040450B1A